MAKHVDYYLTLNSPWTFLGHQRLVAAATRHGATVTPHPTDFSIVFPATGGLPLPKRAPARQAYRMMELRRWKAHLASPINFAPAFWPVDEATAAGMVVALRERGDDALPLAGALMHAVWAEERNIADRDTLLAVAAGCGVDGPALIAEADSGRPAAIREAESKAAVELGVFGAPSYVIDGEIFWGQDRVDFVARALAG